MKRTMVKIIYKGEDADKDMTINTHRDQYCRRGNWPQGRPHGGLQREQICWFVSSPL